jgi:hypothetical protein
MKIKSLKRPTNTKKVVIITSAVFLLAVLTVLVYAYLFNGSLFGWRARATKDSDSSINYGPATKDQQQAGNKAKSGSNSDTPPAPTPTPGSDKKNIQMDITAVSQNGPTLQVRVLLSSVVSDGTCTLTLTKSGQSTVTKTADTQALAKTSTCRGFDIPVSELSSGTWSLSINYSSTSLTGSINQDILIK